MQVTSRYTYLPSRPGCGCCPEANAERPKVVAFREWILSEARKDFEKELP